MRILLLQILFLFLTSAAYGQLPRAYLSKKQMKAMGDLSRSATLMVVIENEKNADDAALISALKKYWKVSPVKYMSGLEFSEKFKEDKLDPTLLYLFNNYTREFETKPGIVSVSHFKGYYLTSFPRKLVNSQADRKAPPYLFFSANNFYDSDDKPIPGFYSLMVKNFNHDLNYCQLEENYTSKISRKRKDGIQFFNPSDIDGKDVLLVKEQTRKQENSKKKKKRKEEKARQGFVTDKYTNKKTPVVVFPEDIDHAVKKSDARVLLYCGGTLYSASDGAVYATSRVKQENGTWTPYRITSTVVSIAAVVLVFTLL